VCKHTKMAEKRAGGVAGPERPDFETRLQKLKAEGCAVLVVGAGAARQHATLCRGLLGDDAVAPRRRLLAFTEGVDGLDERVPAGARIGADTELVTVPTGGARGATAGADGAVGRAAGGGAAPAFSGVADVVGPGDGSVREPRDGSLDALGRELLAALSGLEERHGPFDPAELRVGLDSALALLSTHGEAPTFRFLHLLAALVRRHGALGHVHLPVDRDTYAARLLAPLFDGVVALRVRDGHAQQRWHLDDGAVTSRWLPL
jgi:hypothetical protein